MSYLIGQFQIRRVTALLSDFYDFTFQLAAYRNKRQLTFTDFDFDYSDIMNMSISHSQKISRAIAQTSQR